MWEQDAPGATTLPQPKQFLTSVLKVARMYQKESPLPLIMLNRKWMFVRASAIVKGR